EAGLEFQINTTITRKNSAELPAILDLAVRLGAAAHHIFLLVPTGRARDMDGESVDAKRYEEILNWFYEQREKVPLQLKATCAPHYYRILRQRSRAEGKHVTPQTHGLEAMTRGCLGGIGFLFISHRGDVQPCGYLELSAGSVREETLERIWQSSPLFLKLRDFAALKGRCGRCEFVNVCGGCRARAYEKSQDVMDEEPLCAYQPRSPRASS
ncbi:MAG TPA: SPASM domain-containing protein, partial [Thermodesulfobacteriota bacterium]|nr:SPASM domain-containing protein [Thermodesulfobacteriota bacterium]